jgi:PAS domain-containing protein
LSDGQLAWVLVNATPLRGSEDPAPTGVVVTFADFTRQKAALDALSESEARFRMALSTIQTGVFLSDGQRLFFVNSQ